MGLDNGHLLLCVNTYHQAHITLVLYLHRFILSKLLFQVSFKRLLLFSNPNMLASYLSRKIRYHNYTQFMIRLCLLLWNILLSVGKKSILFVILQEELDEVVRTWNSHKPRMYLKVVQSCCVQSLRCLVQRTDWNWVTKKRWIYVRTLYTQGSITLCWNSVWAICITDAGKWMDSPKDISDAANNRDTTTPLKMVHLSPL